MSRSLIMRNGGVLRNVVKIDQLPAATLLHLDCGHQQERGKVQSYDVPKRVICFPCGTAILSKAKEAVR